MSLSSRVIPLFYTVKERRFFLLDFIWTKDLVLCSEAAPDPSRNRNICPHFIHISRVEQRSFLEDIFLFFDTIRLYYSSGKCYHRGFSHIKRSKLSRTGLIGQMEMERWPDKKFYLLHVFFRICCAKMEGLTFDSN